MVPENEYLVDGYGGSAGAGTFNPPIINVVYANDYWDPYTCEWISFVVADQRASTYTLQYAWWDEYSQPDWTSVPFFMYDNATKVWYQWKVEGGPGGFAQNVVKKVTNPPPIGIGLGSVTCYPPAVNDNFSGNQNNSQYGNQPNGPIEPNAWIWDPYKCKWVTENEINLAAYASVTPYWAYFNNIGWAVYESGFGWTIGGTPTGINCSPFTQGPLGNGVGNGPGIGGGFNPNDTGNNGVSVGIGGGGLGSGPGNGNDTGNNGLSVGNSGPQISPQDPDYCAPLDCYTPPPTPPVPFDPICPEPGYGGQLDPVQGNAIVRSGYVQYANFVGNSWKISNGPKVTSLSEVAESANGWSFSSTSPAIRAYAESYHNIKFVLDAEKGSGQDLDCQGKLKPSGTLSVTVNGKTFLINKVKIKKTAISSYPDEYVVGDMSFGSPMYKITSAPIPTPQDPLPKPPSPIPSPPIPGPTPVGPTPIIPVPPVVNVPQIPKIPVGRWLSNLDRPIKKRWEETYGIWSGGVGNLTALHTCSIHPSASNSWQRSYYTIWNGVCYTACYEPQFDITYGHDAGSGSVDLGGFDNETPTNAVYTQYKQLCLDPSESKFTIGGIETDHIYVLNIKKARMGDRFDEGNWELNLHHLSGSEYVAGGGDQNDYTGSNVTFGAAGNILRLIDNSTLFQYTSSLGGHRYDVVSGSIEEGIYNSTNPHIYGHVYPSLGVIILDANRLDNSASFGTAVPVERHSDNAYKIFYAMSGAAQYTDTSGDVLGFKARRVTTHYDRYFFINVKAGEFNFSNNPTYTSGSEGIIREEFRGIQKAYITSIGLYDNNRNLIAVGKLSKPVLKTMVDEALFTVRLRY